MPERLDKFYSYLVFKSLFVIERCPVSMNIPGTKLGALQMGFKTQTVIFPKTDEVILIKC
jgi:hypothetical protein